MENIQNVFVQLIEKSERKVIIKRGIKAAEYMAYCNEVGCNVWGILTSMPSMSGEPFAEEDYCEAITAVENSMEKYNPSVLGYVWDNENPQIQLEPRGERGYIELKSVKKA